jgi:hypothetical protein
MEEMAPGFRLPNTLGQIGIMLTGLVLLVIGLCEVENWLTTDISSGEWNAGRWGYVGDEWNLASWGSVGSEWEIGRMMDGGQWVGGGSVMAKVVIDEDDGVVGSDADSMEDGTLVQKDIEEGGRVDQDGEGNAGKETPVDNS